MAQLVCAGGKAVPAWGDPGIWYPAQTRVAGKVLLGEITITDNSKNVMWGWDSNQSGVLGADSFILGGGTGDWQIAPTGAPLFTVVNATVYQCALPLRAIGAYYYIKGGVATNWTLLGWLDWNATAALYPGIANYDAAFTADDLRIPAQLWLPTPLLYDTFTRADGALGNSEAVGPDGQVTPIEAWTDSVGTWAISTNKAVCTALAGGIGIATADVGSANVLHSIAVTIGTGTDGIVVRYADANNYIYAIHTGVNAQLVKVVGGVPTTLVNAAAAYVAGAVILVVADTTALRFYYNNALIGTATLVSPADDAVITATKLGMYTTATDGSLDTAMAFPRGNGGEYAALDSM